MLLVCLTKLFQTQSQQQNHLQQQYQRQSVSSNTYHKMGFCLISITVEFLFWFLHSTDNSMNVSTSEASIQKDFQALSIQVRYIKPYKNYQKPYKSHVIKSF